MFKFVEFIDCFYSSSHIVMNLWFFPTLIILSILMFYYVIWRFFVIFGNNSKIIPLVIAVIIAIIVILTFVYEWDSKILDVIWTLWSWIFVLWFLLLIMLLVENIISIWYKVNPRIVVWIIIVILWIWTYFSLHTKITNLNIKSEKIHEDAKILLVSDIHTENVMQTFHINKILKAIETEKPDFVVLAWDLMNKPNSTYINYFSKFKSVKNIPIFAVMWNHDVMWNTEVVKKIPEVSGIKFLNNETVEVNWIQLIWLIDKSLWWNNSVKGIMDQLEIDNNSDFSILVTHQPVRLEKLEDYPIDLEVAWHTHRGQFYGIMELSRVANDYFYWEYKLWNKTAFVTQWIWTWWFPFRLWTQSEMVIINLKK